MNQKLIQQSITNKNSRFLNNEFTTYSWGFGVLGFWGFGKVFLVSNRKMGKMYAMKRINKDLLL